MHKQMVEQIRQWLTESQALDEMATIPLTYTQHEDFDLRFRMWMGARATSVEGWLTALLDFYDTEQARLARAADIFGAAIAEVEARRMEADSARVARE